MMFLSIFKALFVKYISHQQKRAVRQERDMMARPPSRARTAGSKEAFDFSVSGSSSSSDSFLVSIVVSSSWIGSSVVGSNVAEGSTVEGAISHGSSVVKKKTVRHLTKPTK